MLAKGFGDKPVEAVRKPRDIKPSKPCPCFSGKTYGECCKPFHDGDKLPQPYELMRARYAAYSRGLIKYIMDTTHPDNEGFGKPRWDREIQSVCKAYRFTGLAVDDPEVDPADPNTVIVYFTALMSGADGKGTAMLDEKSSFVQQDGVWLYKDSDKEFQKSEELIMQRRRARAAAKADQASNTVPR